MDLRGAEQVGVEGVLQGLVLPHDGESTALQVVVIVVAHVVLLEQPPLEQCSAVATSTLTAGEAAEEEQALTPPSSTSPQRRSGQALSGVASGLIVVAHGVGVISATLPSLHDLPHAAAIKVRQKRSAAVEVRRSTNVARDDPMAELRRGCERCRSAVCTAFVEEDV